MRKKQNKDFTLKDLEKSLSQQTVVILDTVDKKLVKTGNELREEMSQQAVIILDAVDKKLEKTGNELREEMSQQAIIILDAVDKKLEKTTKEFKKEINALRISIDKFVGFYTKQEQEFTIMKEHLKRLEARVVNLEAKLT